MQVVELLRSALCEQLRLHPRIAQQRQVQLDGESRERLAMSLPPLVPFRGRTLHGVVGVLDWDHHLPSRKFTLRLHTFYNASSLAHFELAFKERLSEIKRKDIFPEFDVPDFADLPGDESYDVDLTEALTVESMRLVSPWRRQLPDEIGDTAVATVRNSPQFAQARAGYPSRPLHLGDLEAVGWTPPCESGQPQWTVDVWWLTAFDGRHGRGWSFLVDIEAPGKVVSHREFAVRTG